LSKDYFSKTFGLNHDYPKYFKTFGLNHDYIRMKYEIFCATKEMFSPFLRYMEK